MANLLLTRLPMPVKVGAPIGTPASTRCALPDGAPAELGGAA